MSKNQIFCIDSLGLVVYNKEKKKGTKMKKFLMYVVVLASVLFISYTVYFFVRNNETISLTLAENEVIYMNVDDKYDLPIKWTKPHSSTKLTVKVLDDSIVEYVEETKSFYAKLGGNTSVEITTSNKSFGPFRFDIHVGDGSTEYPYVIRTEEELASIGVDVDNVIKFPLSASYILISDLDLVGYESWSPIGGNLGFTGSFDGNHKSISNMKISGDKTNAGLFASISQSSVIENLYMQNCTLSGNFDNAGIIAGSSTAGTIRLCKITSSKIENTKLSSNNGGVVGKVVNTKLSTGEFSSFGYVELNSVEVSAKTSGNFGGIVGYMQGSILINNKAYIKNYESTQSSTYVGLIAGVMNYADSSNYMFSVIKKCMAIAENITNNTLSAKIGAIVGKYIDNTSSDYSNIIKSCYYYTPTSGTSKVAESNKNTVDVSTVYAKGIADMKEKATFSDWDFSSIWTTKDDTEINEINFDEAQSESFNELLPGEKIETESGLWVIFENMKNNPSAGTVYNIKKTDSNKGVITLDLKEHGMEEWQTIAPSSSNPIRSSIVCDDDVEIVIKNGKITGGNSSFFGYISGLTTKFNNITFENVNVSSTNSKVAVAFTGIQNGATVDNIKVKDCNVESSGTDSVSYLGTISAINDGIIQNCKTSSSDENTIKTSNKQSRIGGTVGKNSNQVKNVTVDGYKIVLDYVGQDATAYIGGICSELSNGSLQNCYFTNGYIENENYYSSLYCGGVVANIFNATKVYQCIAEGSLKANTSTSGKYVGGVVAYSNGGEINSSYFKGSISGNSVAGVCVINKGAVTQCYADGELTGVYVGGIAVYNNITITNCYFRGNLVGLTTDSISCGICVTLPEGSSVTNCFAKVDFVSGKGTKYAETSATFRAAFERWVGNLSLWGWWEDYKEPTGTFTNSIIVYSGDDVNIQKTLIFNNKTGWIDCSDNEAQGITGDYAKFKVDAKFDISIWGFDSGYPYLKNVPVIGSEQ